MSLLDNLLGGMMGGAQQGQSPLLQAALQLIQQNGGLPGIISKFEHGGMADHVGSWVGTGANMPISRTDSKPGSVDAIVGRPGVSDEGFKVPTASSLILPDFT